MSRLEFYSRLVLSCFFLPGVNQGALQLFIGQIINNGEHYYRNRKILSYYIFRGQSFLKKQRDCRGTSQRAKEWEHSQHAEKKKGRCYLHNIGPE
jgi:hypothetical protein